jgi:uncharacterized membrane-anchored protein YjiN (DUF445 family)
MNYKRKANMTVAFVGVGFIVTAVLKAYYNVAIIKMLFYIMEAALIGGMADWFAVTAIFKKPLGFPFHTAIIPKNRVTIINSVVDIVEKEFLSAAIISEKLEKIDITDKILNWLHSKEGKDYLRKLILRIVDNGLQGDGARKLSDMINQIVSENLKEVNINGYLNKFFEWGLNSGEYKKVLAVVLEDIIKVAEGPGIRNKIYTIIDDLKAEKTQGLLGALVNSALQGTNMVNIGEIADSIHMQLIQTLYNLKNEENAETKLILSTIEEHLLLNGKNPFMDKDLDNIKEYLINNIISETTIREALIGISGELKKLEKIEEKSILDINENQGFYILLREIKELFINLENNNNLKNNIEKFIKKSISSIIKKEHNVIGKIVRDTLDSFDDKALNKFIEDRAGNDLQWIRINGSIVGGMVGLIVFLFLTYFYDPIAVPFLRNLF